MILYNNDKNFIQQVYQNKQLQGGWPSDSSWQEFSFEWGRLTEKGNTCIDDKQRILIDICTCKIF